MKSTAPLLLATQCILIVAIVVAALLAVWLPLAKDRNYMTRAIDSKPVGRIARWPPAVLYTMAFGGVALSGFGQPLAILGVILAVAGFITLARRRKDQA